MDSSGSSSCHVGGVVLHPQHHDLQVRIGLFELLGEIEAVLVVELVIKQDQIRLVLLDKLLGFFAGRSLPQHLEARLPLEHAL